MIICIFLNLKSFTNDLIWLSNIDLVYNDAMSIYTNFLNIHSKKIVNSSKSTICLMENSTSVSFFWPEPTRVGHCYESLARTRTWYRYLEDTGRNWKESRREFAIVVFFRTMLVLSIRSLTPKKNLMMLYTKTTVVLIKMYEKYEKSSIILRHSLSHFSAPIFCTFFVYSFLELRWRSIWYS
jgi:hypothetical protein